MRLRIGSWGAAALLAGVLACGVRVKPGLQVTGAKLQAKFDRPMVGPEALGRDAAPDAPLRLRPQVPGQLRWLDTRTLAFVPAEHLPGSTRFELEVPAGTQALDGTGIRSAVRWTFETERLRVDLAGESGDPGNWARPDQAVVLVFNQPVRAADVEHHCVYASDAGSEPAVIDNAGELEETRRRFHVTPKAALRLDTAWRFRCDAALSGTEGPLPLETTRPGPDGGVEAAAELAFRTYGPFRATLAEPHAREVSPDDVEITVTFTNPLDTIDGPPPIKIDPEVEGFAELASVETDRISMTARALKPNTAYTVTVDGSLGDRFGQHLSGPFVAKFTTGKGTPRLDVETGAWVVESSRAAYVGWTRNITRIEADLVSVPEAKLGALAGAIDWWDDEPVNLKKLGLRAVHATIPVHGKENEWGQVNIAPGELLGAPSPGPGLYYLALRAPEEPARRDPDEETPDTPAKAPPPRELLLNFTNLGLTAKLAGPTGLVWVTRLSDGKPQAGATVTIRDRHGKVKWHGSTDADGVALTPGRGQLLPAHSRLAARRDDGEEEGADDAVNAAAAGEEGVEGDDFTGPRPAELLVFARVGNDVTWVNPEHEGALAAWSFHVDADRTQQWEQLRGFLHSDRGLYRPGDVVHLRGLARTMKLGGALRVPAVKNVMVTVRDPRGEEILKKTTALSRYGGFSLDVPTAESARLGDYRVTARLTSARPAASARRASPSMDGEFSERFSVEQYRAATFEVKVSPPAKEPIAGETLRLTAEARYLYGAPLGKGALTWRVYRRSREVSFPELPAFEFGDARTAYDDYVSQSAVSESLVREDERTLDKNGRGRITVKLHKDEFRSAQDLVVSAEVQDETHQTIAAHLAIPAHPAAIYFGVDRGSPVAEVRKPRALSVVAVDPKGKRVSGNATLRVMKRTWSCAWEAFGYRGDYRCEKKESEALRQPLAIPEVGSATVKWAPASPGEYFVIVEGADANGRPAATAAELWTWGDGEPAWQADDGERFDVVADKSKYAVGETAHLLLKTDLHDAAGLLTIERDGVLERKAITVGGGTSVVDVPIKEGYGPNVYASVMLVKGRSGKGSRGLPRMRMGMASLAVDTEAKRLKVSVRPDRESYRPGDPVGVELRVTDASGKPVQTEIALAAADEGVLTLVGFKTPDPVATFYAPWGLGVTTATQYERLAHLPEPGETRAATGGDGGAPGTFRSRFLATAYWNPAIETDANGRAKVTFAAPDNITAYRLMAVAADGGERFGSGDTRFTVRKPLQLLAAMPRFLNVGDEARGGVVVINDTGKDGTVVLDASVTGARALGAPHQELAVAAGGRAAVTFPVRAERAGELKVRVKAKLGAETDGLEMKLPVQYPAPVETAAVAAGETSGTVSIPVKLPAGVLPGSASLELSTDPDGVAGLDEALRDLIEYPYGCLEQTTSRLIPLVAVEELARALKLPGLDGKALQTFIRAGIGKLARFQTEEGGYSLWVGGRPEPFLTAFALWGLKLARDAGHPVTRGMIDGGVRWLHRALAGEARVAGPVDDLLGEMGSRAFAVHVLALLDSPDPGYASKLLEQRAQLPRFGTAFLAQALALNLGPKHAAVTGLLDDLTRAVDTRGGAAVIREIAGHDLGYYMSDDIRTTAIATDAFLDLRPEEPTLPLLVKGLLAERRDGEWATTQDNLFALVSLVHYVKSRPPRDVAVRATLGGKSILDGPLVGQSVRIRRATVAIDQATTAAPLTIAARGGELFYSSVVRFRRDLAHQQGTANGIEVRREYIDPRTNATIDPKEGVTAGQIVRVRVTVSPSGFGKHIAVEDPLPAGLEAINTKLVTSGAAPKGGRDGGGRAAGEDEDGEPAWWQPVARELRDDRVLVFFEQLPKGPQSFTYLARATTTGRYVAAGASAGEMYDPATSARTAPITFVVRDK